MNFLAEKYEYIKKDRDNQTSEIQSRIGVGWEVFRKLRYILKNIVIPV